MEFNYSLICKDNILILSVEKLWKDSEMAVYVYCNDERLEVSWYKECFEYQFKIPEKLVSENFYLSIFIKNGSKIYSKKTIVVNPETCQKKISLDLFEINNLSNIFDIEKYVNTLAIKSHCSLCDLIHNLVENNYSFNNLLFTDYIFIRYSLFKLGLPGNWSNDEFSLGLLNEASINEILELSQVWYSGLKITDFTKSLIKSFYYMNKGDYDMTYDVLNLFEIPKNYYFSVYFQGLITYQSTVLDKLNFPYTVKETSIVASPNQLTIVFSCNKIYFDKFFHNTLESLVSVYNSFNIAISLVNFTESDMEEFIFIKLDIEKNIIL